jgi:hypothetical protein
MLSEELKKKLRTRHEQEKKAFRLGERDYDQIDKEEFYEMYTFLMKMIRVILNNEDLTNRQKISKIKSNVIYLDCALGFQNGELQVDRELLIKHPYSARSA